MTTIDDALALGDPLPDDFSASENGVDQPLSSQTLPLSTSVDIAARLEKIKAAQNPLLEAAKPLLLAIAQTPKELADNASIEAWYELLHREVTLFTQLCNKANILREHVVAASFCLCTALDEAANSTRWGGSTRAGQAGPWSAQQLAARFHGDVQGGKKFFLLIGRLSSNTEEHLDLLEVMYHILSLGFEGQYSTVANGKRELETIRHRLMTIISTARGSVPRDLSPHWQGAVLQKLKLWRELPVWINASLLGLLVFALFCWYKYELVQETRVVEEKITSIDRLKPPPVPILRLKELLKEEIARQQVIVYEDEFISAVTFRSDDMFVPGQAEVNQGILPLLDRIAVEISKVPGTVQVIGHSDNMPIKTARFPNNYVLSQERALNVAKELEARGVLASRIQTEGKGADDPVADNSTRAGRARNRRVQIVVQQGAPISAAIAPATSVVPSVPVPHSATRQ